MTALRGYLAATVQPLFDEAPQRYDEFAAPDGTLRPAWRPLAAELGDLTAERLRRLRHEISRFLTDDGVTYTPPGEEPGAWRLDPLPFVIDAAEWAALDAGLAQRGELLEAVAADLYGPRRLLHEGIVPAAAVLAHAGYLRPLVRGDAAERAPLPFLATDLGRDASGEWRVLADRTQAPSGIGYAMENRRVISRVLPELYRQAGLHRLAPYFQAMRSSLLAAAPDDVPNPRVVVLTPGSLSETAYDQAFVASSLGFPLVQGSDLTVRDGAVWMRVLGRFERVDVIVRRVDAAWSDPLELLGDSQLGVAGLAEAARRGTVRIVNGLGAGALENPGLMPYLGAACEALLGEPLRLQPVETRWLGDPAGLAEVLDDRESWQVRPIDAGETRATGDAAPRDVEADLASTPYRFVAQRLPELSQSVAAHGLGLAPATITLRTFTIRYGSGYRPLMGGLATMVDGGRAVSSKDVWVLKASPEDPDQGLTGVLAMTNVRAPAAMVARVLEDMFWLGRYAERAEDLLRLALHTHGVAEDFRSRPHSTGGSVLRVLLDTLATLTPSTGGDLDADFRAVLLDPHRPGSVAQAMAAARDAAQATRDQLSPDVWRAFGAVERAALDLVERPHSHQIADSAGRMLAGVLSLYGVTDQMVRDPSWHMIAAGRHLERAHQLGRLLRATTTVRRGLDVDREIHQAVLTVAESAVTHRRRYRDQLRLPSVLELLLLDGDNPRSLRFCLARLTEHLAAMPGSTGSSRPERLVQDLDQLLDELDLAALVVVDGETRVHLANWLGTLIGQLNRLGDAVTEVHLAAGPAPRSFGLVGRSA